MATAKQARRLGILHLTLGVLSLVLALVAYQPLADLIGSVAMLLLVAAAFPQLIAGLSLLSGKAWSKPIALIAGALSLVSIPLGTVLGLYTISVLTTPSDGGEEELTELP